MTRLCGETGCNRGLRAKGLCHLHYERARRAAETRVCTLDGCDRPYVAKGWCRVHYQRARANGGDPGPGDLRPPIDHGAFTHARPGRWYWVGFLAADGCVSDEANVQLRLAACDLSHIEALRAYVGAGAPGSAAGRISGPHKGSYRLTIRSRRIADDLAELGAIKPRKSLSYTPTARAAVQTDFWLGMLDGDGTAYWHADARWSSRRPELIWSGSRAAMTSCVAFWREQLPAHRVSASLT